MSLTAVVSQGEVSCARLLNRASKRIDEVLSGGEGGRSAAYGGGGLLVLVLVIVILVILVR